MTFETAKRTLDYIFNIVEYRTYKQLGIAFYGGEPILNFDLIREIIEYARKIFKDWSLFFSMTTNGTIIDINIIRFLKENDVSLCISLDGPREIHDSKRVTHKGNGSYEIVWKNLNQIACYEPEYFKRRVKFNAVLSKELPLEEVYSFFSNTEPIRNIPITLNFVVDRKTEYFQIFPYDADRFIKAFNRIKMKINDLLLLQLQQ